MTQREVYYGWWIVGASFSILLVTVGVGLYAPPVFLVPLQEHFGWSRAAIAGGGAVAALTVGIASPLVGVGIDRYGSRKVMTAGALVMGFAFCLFGTIQSLWQLYLLNVIAAFGIASVAWLPNQTLIANWFDRMRGRAMGRTLAGIGFGGLAIPPLTGLLIAEFGWRIAFATLGSLVLLIVVTVILALVRSKPEDMGLLPDGDLPPAETPAGDPTHETRAEELIEGLSLGESLRTGAFWILSLVHVLWSFGSMSIIGHLPAFLTDQGFGKLAEGSLALAIGCSVVGRVGFGVLADRFSKRWIMSLTVILHAVGVACLFRVHAPGALPAFVIVFGLALGGGAVLVPLLIGEYFGLRAFGKVLGVVTISATLGAATGPVATGRIFDVTGSYDLAFLLHIVAFTAAALAILTLRRPRAAPR
jgi:sugar phosphate permease